jgi:hypothetical protein
MLAALRDEPSPKLARRWPMKTTHQSELRQGEVRLSDERVETLFRGSICSASPSSKAKTA